MSFIEVLIFGQFGSALAALWAFGPFLFRLALLPEDVSRIVMLFGLVALVNLALAFATVHRVYALPNHHRFHKVSSASDH